MLPQGSSFGLCKAELFRDKGAIWKTAEKNQQEDSTDWWTQNPRSKPEFPSIPAA